MTISNTTSAPLYSGNGVTTDFATGFQFITNSHVQVILVSSLGVETVQTETTHYTLVGAGNPAGGTVTMITPPASGQKLKIRMDIPLTQTTDYVEGTSFPATTHESALDKLTLIAQQTSLDLSRAPALKSSSTLYPLEFPDGGAAEAGKVLRYNTSDGTTLELASPDDLSIQGGLLGSSTGILVQTSVGGAYAARSVAAGTGISVSNGDGVAGNPTVSIADAELLAIAGLTSAADKGIQFTGSGTAATYDLTAAGKDLLDDASASDQRTTLGLGTIATQDASNVTITGGSISGITAVAVDDGGTGVASLTAYAPIFGGTTATGAVQSGTVGTTGQVLTSNGAGMLPTFENIGTLTLDINGLTEVTAPDGADELAVYDASAAANRKLTLSNLVTGQVEDTSPDKSNDFLITYDASAGTTKKVRPTHLQTWELIATATAANSASIDFTGLTSSYSAYVLIINNLYAATSAANLTLRTSSNNGSSYDSGASDYSYTYALASPVGQTAVGANGASAVLVTPSVANASNATLGGTITIYNPSSTLDTQITGIVSYTSSGGNHTHVTMSGIRNSASAAVNAFRLVMSSGNITAGTFALYGIKNTNS